MRLAFAACSIVMALAAHSFAQTDPTIDTIAGMGYGDEVGDEDGVLAVQTGVAPTRLAIDGSGNLYFVDEWSSKRIRRIDAFTGIITTVAGGGTQVAPNDGIQATDAQLMSTQSIAVDHDGNLYFDDWQSSAPGFWQSLHFFGGGWGFINGVDGNGYSLTSPASVIRKVDASTGIITTIAGGGAALRVESHTVEFSPGRHGLPQDVTISFGLASGDGGPALEAFLGDVKDLAIDGDGNLLFVDRFQIRRIDGATQVISTIAGNDATEFLPNVGGSAVQVVGGEVHVGALVGVDSGDGAPATLAGLFNPMSLALDGTGSLYIGSTWLGEPLTSLGLDHGRVRKVDATTGMISTIAGNDQFGYDGDGGPAIDASLGLANGLAVDAHGNLFIADHEFSVIRRVDAVTGVISTVAGSGTSGFSGDGGPAIEAVLDRPWDLALDPAGNLYVSDYFNYRIRRIVGLINAPPTANAGVDRSIHASGIVQLDGSDSFDDNTATAELGFAWTFASRPVGSTSALIDSDTPTPHFVADLPGSYLIELVVTDEGGLASAPDEIEVASINLAPTADAGPDLGGVVGQSVALDGSSSFDPDLDAITWSWSFTALPVGSTATFDDPHFATPTFLPDLPGLYVAALVVHDGFAPSAPDEVSITVVTGEEFASTTITEAINTIADLPPSAVATSGNQKSLTQTLASAEQNLDRGKILQARSKLEQALERVDGVALRGRPDPAGPGRDWVTDPVAQLALYQELMAALDALE